MKKNLDFFQKTWKIMKLLKYKPWITLIFFLWKMSGNPVFDLVIFVTEPAFTLGINIMWGRKMQVY